MRQHCDVYTKYKYGIVHDHIDQWLFCGDAQSFIYLLFNLANTLIYVFTQENDEHWMCVMEKAYAKLVHTYPLSITEY